LVDHFSGGIPWVYALDAPLPDLPEQDDIGIGWTDVIAALRGHALAGGSIFFLICFRIPLTRLDTRITSLQRDAWAEMSDDDQTGPQPATIKISSNQPLHKPSRPDATARAIIVS
jgi:hypothetical protein